MLRQQSIEEKSEEQRYAHSYDLQSEEVRIEGVAETGMSYLRRWVFSLTCITLTAMIGLSALMTGHVRPSLLIACVFTLVVVSLMVWLETSLIAQFWPKKARPVLVLSSRGLSLEGPLKLEAIPWEEIAEVQGISLLGFPILALKDRDGQIKKRLGGRYWLYWWPGGIGLNALTFGDSGKQLAERIRAYRAGLISG